jgi:hypothetical protein
MLEGFYQEFPEGKSLLHELFSHVYEGAPLKTKPVALVTLVINSVLQQILRRLDELGRERAK